MTIFLIVLVIVLLIVAYLALKAWAVKKAIKQGKNFVKNVSGVDVDSLFSE